MDLLSLRKLYEKGVNITRHLRDKFGVEETPSYFIKYAYDLQAGTYTELYERKQEIWKAIGAERAQIIDKYTDSSGLLLDCGTGECCSLVSILNHLEQTPARVYAFDISFSRVMFGRKFATKHLVNSNYEVNLAVADLNFLPFQDDTFDNVLTTESLEPNHGNEARIIKELLRVTRSKLFMIEPYYEGSSPEIRARLDHHNYVRNLPEIVKQLGGEVVAIEPLKTNLVNDLNPYWVFVVQKKQAAARRSDLEIIYQCPVTHTPLTPHGGILLSDEAGLAYPVVDGVPLIEQINSFPASYYRSRNR
jgi:ubiquinone/menaquinone biosynthesis C-methylase UbiE/uncharacterized protein YbaR (Trm112 family)